MARTSLALAVAGLASAATAARPNIIMIITDDQDVEMGSLQYMPKLKAALADQGATFSRMYAHVPVCCPSRSSLYSGLYQHNNHVLGNGIPTNCSSLAWQAGPEKNSFAVHLQQAGYVTSFAGKYLNMYGDPAVGGTAHVPPGWTNWHGLVGNSVYYDYTISANGVAVHHGNDYATDYLTDLTLNRTLDFMEANAGGAAPLFAMMSTPASHGPDAPAPQYAALLPDVKAPRSPAWNATVPGAHWLQAKQAVYGLDANSAAFADHYFRRRLLTLQSVDDAVEALVAKAAALGSLNNTFFLYTTDNGYHTGQYGFIYDKRQPWETDTHLPLLVRGPGVAAGVTVPAIVSMPDLAATILDIAGAAVPALYDGASILPYLLRQTQQQQPQPQATSQATAATPRIAALVEYHGESSGGGAAGGVCARTHGQPLFCGADGNSSTPPYWYGDDVCVCQDATNNTYSCLRVRDDAAAADYRYCEFADDASTVEYFDFATDPFELTNAAAQLAPAARAALSQRLATAVACRGAAACDKALTEPIALADGSPLGDPLLLRRSFH